MEKQGLYIKTFGCQMNVRDSEVMAQLLAPLGFALVDSATEADLVILNTCAVRTKAEEKVYSLLGQLRLLQQERSALLLGVVGCVAQLAASKLVQRFDCLDFVLGPRQLHLLPGIIERLQSASLPKPLVYLGATDDPVEVFPRAPPPTLHDGHKTIRRFVTIMQGCDNHCSYCVVPHTRGSEISRPLADILQEVEEAVDHGVREIFLLGQNVNSYGRKNAVAPMPVSFAQLLRHVALIPGVRRLRFTTSHPRDLDEELMRCFAEIDCLCPYLHLPVQAGADRVLQRMNRGYTRSEYLARVCRLRQFRPDVALGTDLIVGFPGESEDDFLQTLALLEEVRFHGAYSFKYSDRPHTVSLSFDDKVQESVKAERLLRLQQLQDKITLERHREYCDSELEVMVEQEAQPGMAQGRSPGYQLVHWPHSSDLPPLIPGSMIRVVVRRPCQHVLMGEEVTAAGH